MTYVTYVFVLFVIRVVDLQTLTAYPGPCGLLAKEGHMVLVLYKGGGIMVCWAKQKNKCIIYDQESECVL